MKNALKILPFKAEKNQNFSHQIAPPKTPSETDSPRGLSAEFYGNPAFVAGVGAGGSGGASRERGSIIAGCSDPGFDSPQKGIGLESGCWHLLSVSASRRHVG